MSLSIVNASVVDRLIFWLSENEIEKVESCHAFNFGTPFFKDSQFISCPFESGRIGLMQVFVKTPSDPGDQHFYRYKFYKYL